jgi:hypothetical protein
MTKVVWGARMRLVAAIILLLGSMSCGDLTRQGQASSYLIITTLQGSSGAATGAFSTVLQSDVVTLVNNVPTVFADPGQVVFALGLKDPGTPASPTNSITVDRYHVTYIRADGRNTPGVDVPYPFDGAFTVTVPVVTTAGFTLVRVQAKEEAPLKALASGLVVISTIAEVTFYGHDQTGREVSATGHIGVDFANWGDK